ncbi:MAG: hypothetical protein ACR2MT_00665 [Aurantibacter sp.]
METKRGPEHVEGQNQKMRLVQIIRILFVLCVVAPLIGCSKDESFKEPDMINPLEPQGNLVDPLEEIKDYYSVEFVDGMINLGFEINLGNNPPDLEGSYAIDPFVMYASSVEGEEGLVGNSFKEYVMTFSNQDNGSRTLDYSGQGALEVDEGTGAFIIGNNGAFTMYTKAVSQIGNFTADIAVAVSGTLTAEGIENVQIYGAMLNDHGDPENVYIENNKGRIFVDGDGLASRQSSESGKQSKTQNSDRGWGFGIIYPN